MYTIRKRYYLFYVVIFIIFVFGSAFPSFADSGNSQAIDQPPEPMDPTAVDLPPGTKLIEGDMIVPENYNTRSETRGTYVFKPWPNGVIPYEFDSSVDSAMASNILAAMQMWEDGVGSMNRPTPVQFRPRVPGDSGWITVEVDPDRECNCGVAQVGYDSGSRSVTLGIFSSPGLIAHELGHSMGLKHEQTHPARDQYVTIEWDNIQSDKKHNFEIDSDQFGFAGIAYDYGSLMHYGQYTFSKCEDPSSDPVNCRTITVKNNDPATNWQANIGMSSTPTMGDLDTIIYMYSFCSTNGNPLAMNESIAIPPDKLGGTVFLNGWYTFYGNKDHHVKNVQVSIENVNMSGGMLNWSVIGQLRDKNADDPFCFYYHPEFVWWDDKDIVASANDNLVANAEGSGAIQLTSVGDPDIGVLPRGFKIRIADLDDGDDRHLRRLAYTLYQSNAVAEYSDDSVQEFQFTHYFTGLTGSSINYVPFPTQSQSHLCGGGVSATQCTTTITIENVDYDEAIPVLGDWNLTYQGGGDDHHVREIGAWISDWEYSGTTMTVDVTHILADDSNNSSNRQIRVSVLGIAYEPDKDGVGTDIEDDAPNNGDGNDDGCPDSLQSHVASLPNAVDGTYVTIAIVLAGTYCDGNSPIWLQYVEGIADPSEIDWIGTPIGLFGYEVHGLAPGQSVEVEVIDHGNTDTPIYYKDPNTDPGNAFAFRRNDEDTLGAAKEGNTFTLYLIDNELGDFDATPALIRDPGGPAEVYDLAAPSTNVSNITGTEGLHDWYTTPVTVNLNAEDNGTPDAIDPSIIYLSGVYRTYYKVNDGPETLYDGSIYIDTEGINTLEFRSEDMAANLEDWQSVEIKIDTRPPEIDISSDKDVYTRVELIEFAIKVSDPEPGSGVWLWEAFFNGDPIVDGSAVDPFWWNLGDYAYDGWVQDYAGWISTDDGSIDLIATLDSLSPTVDRLCDEDYILGDTVQGNNQAICSSLQAKLRAAINSADRGQPSVVVSLLNSFLHEIQALRAKHITQSAYHILNQDVMYVIVSLGGVPAGMDMMVDELEQMVIDGVLNAIQRDQLVSILHVAKQYVGAEDFMAATTQLEMFITEVNAMGIGPALTDLLVMNANLLLTILNPIEETELMLNGSFDIGSPESISVYSWNFKAADLKCNGSDKVFAFSDDCALKLKAPTNGKAKAVQRVANVVDTNATLLLSAYIQSRNLTANGKLIVKIRYTDGSIEKAKLDVLNGTTPYQLYTTSLKMNGKDVRVVKVVAKIKQGSGQILVDDISLISTNAGISTQPIVVSPQYRSEQPLIPLPELPNNFRD